MIKKKKQILITDHLFKKDNFYQYKKLKNKFDIIFNTSNKPYNKETLKKVLDKNKDVLGIIAGLENYDDTTLKGINSLKVISRVGVGLDSLDLNYIKKRKIKVLKLQNELTDSVAELYLTLILSALRKIIPNYQLLKKKIWSPVVGNNLKNKKIGIIGYGKIGKKLFGLLKVFNCKTYIFEKKKMKNLKIRKKNLDFIFKNCDVVCVSLNLNSSTKEIINSKILKKAKKKIIIINASRGMIINENDLYKFLKKNDSASAFLDCFVKEPYDGKLINLNNVFAIPHIASFTHETRKDMEFSASKNLIKFLK